MPSWKISTGDDDTRLDAAVAKHLEISVGEARRLIDEGLVRLEGKRAKKGLRVGPGARIDVQIEVRAGERLRDRAAVPDVSVQLDVVYEDDVMIAVNKPAGLPSHPLRPDERGTVANALVAHAPSCATASDDPREGGLVHRLDRGTTGVLLAAKNPTAWATLRRSFTDGEVEKIYWALTQGVPAVQGAASIVVDAPLVTRGGTARVRPSDPEALSARTELRVLVAGAGYALVEARAHSGRMHQIRAHLAHLGHPLVGDRRYGAAPVEGVPDDEALLHARALSIPHPVDGWRVSLAAPVPSARRSLFERLLGQRILEAATAGSASPARPR